MLLIVGLDGATWDLLGPWMAQGRLPNLRALCDRGAYGPLTATMPPATFPSWTTFMTGVNPGRHGIFDFTRREPHEYRVRFVNGTFRKAPTVWRLLSDAGRRVCVLGLPGTYPPEPVNGVMLSGWDTPVTTRADASFVYPPEKAAQVAALGGFPFADFQEFRTGPGWHHQALERLLRGIETKVRLSTALIREAAWDCFLILFGESDTVAHHFWRFHDRQSPRHGGTGTDDLGDAIGRVYAALDAAVGRLRELLPEADVLIASDHGFGGVGRKALHLNRWLAERGWLRFARDGGGALATRLKRHALHWVPPAFQARLFRWRGASLANRLESQARFSGIDWARTQVFSEELNYFPSFWLNVRGREALGTVAPEDYERVCREVCAAAAEWKDPEHGRPIVRRAWRRDELYAGPWIKFAPDIILDLNEDSGYSYTCLPSRSQPGDATIRRLSPVECGGGKLAGMSGSHRREGVFVLSGPNVRHDGWMEGIQMADMTPTILSLCAVESHEDFDGETVSSIVSDRQSARSTGRQDASVERVYGVREEAEIAARLTDLGYLE